MSKFEYPELPPRAKPRPLFDKRTAFFSALILAMFITLIFLEIRSEKSVRKSSAVPGHEEARTGPDAASVWTPSLQRAYAQKLVSKGLKKEAVQAFKDYLATPGVPLSEIASVNYTVGKLLFDEADYEAALGAFYQAEVAGAPGDLKSEIDRKIVSCLEKLGKSFDAQAELKQRTALVPSKEATDETRALVLAKIGEESVTLGQINDQLQSLQQTQPKLVEAMRTDKAKLLEFVRQFVFERVLARKARRMGIDQQPEFRKQMEELMDQALAQVLIRQEIQEKVKLAPEDLKLYYEANRARYVQKAEAKVRHILLEDEETAKKVLGLASSGQDFAGLAKEHSKDAATAAQGGVLKHPVTEGAKEIPGIGQSEEFVKTVFETPPGTVAGAVVQSSAGFHVIKVEAVTPSKPLSLQDAQRQAAYDYQLEKSQAALNRMLQETLEVERAQIYESVILGQKGSLEVKSEP